MFLEMMPLTLPVPSGDPLSPAMLSLTTGAELGVLGKGKELSLGYPRGRVFISLSFLFLTLVHSIHPCFC